MDQPEMWNSPARALWILMTIGLYPFMPVRAADVQFVIQIKDHRFVPAELVIPSGVKVSIVLDNQDDTPEEFDSHAPVSYTHLTLPTNREV